MSKRAFIKLIEAARLKLAINISLKIALYLGAVLAFATGFTGSLLILAGLIPLSLLKNLVLIISLSGMSISFVLFFLMKRVGLDHAAAWLDRGRGDDGLFASALHCHMEALRRSPDRTAEFIQNRADNQAEIMSRPRIPAGFILKPALAFGACLSCILLLLALMPAFPQKSADTSAYKKITGQELGADAPSDTIELLSRAADRMSAEELASLIFPDRPDLAELLARALREERLEDAQRIIEKAGLARGELGSGLDSLSESLTRFEKLPEQGQSRESQPDGSSEDGGLGDFSSDGGGLPGMTPDMGGLNSPMERQRLREPEMELPPGGGDEEESDIPVIPERDAPHAELPSPRMGEELEGEFQEDLPAIGEGSRDGQTDLGSGLRKFWGDIDAEARGEELELVAPDSGAWFEMTLSDRESITERLEQIMESERILEEAVRQGKYPREYLEAIKEYFLILKNSGVWAGGNE